MNTAAFKKVLSGWQASSRFLGLAIILAGVVALLAIFSPGFFFAAEALATSASSSAYSSTTTGSLSTTTSSPLAISGLQTMDVAQTSARLVWQTNFAGDSQVYLGTTAGAYSQSSTNRCDNSGLVSSHCVVISGLLPSTTYFYKAISHDSSNYPYSSAEASFATTALPATATTTYITSTTTPANTAATSSPSLSIGTSGKILTGTVLFEGGQPIPDAEVTAYGQNAGQYLSALVGTDGKYTLPLGPGNWQVSYQPVHPSADNWTGSVVPTQVGFGGSDAPEYQTLNFSVPLATNEIIISVKDDAGQPIPSAGVMVGTQAAAAGTVPQTSAVSQYKVTGTDGTAKFLVRPGAYYVRASVSSSLNYINPGEQKVDTTAQSQNIALVFLRASQAPQSAINGIVTSASGAAVSGASVWGWSDKGGSASAMSDQNGRFSFPAALDQNWHAGASKVIGNLPYQSAEQAVTASADAEVTLPLVLVSAKPLPPPVNTTAPASQPITVTSQNGAQVAIPQGAAASGGTVSVQISPTTETPSQADAHVVGTAYDITIKDASGSNISHLNSEVSITLPYIVSQLNKLGTSEDKITPSYYDLTTDSWVKVSNFNIDKTRKVVVLRVSHLTRFALVAPADIIPPPPPTSLAAWLSGITEVSLAWSDPKVDYHHTAVYRSQASSDTGTVVDPLETTGAFTDNDVILGQTYYYRLQAVDAAGNLSTMGAPIMVTVTGEVQPAPSFPSSSSIKLIKSGSTYYAIIGGAKYGITNPGILASYGLTFSQAHAASMDEDSLPTSDLLAPNDGVLAKSAQDPTVWLISGGQRRGFVSEAVFKGLGFSFGQVLTVTAPELTKLPAGADLADPAAAHLEGLDINNGGTIYWLDQNGTRQAYTSAATYNSWHVANDFSKVVKANAADLVLPVGNVVQSRTIE